MAIMLNYWVTDRERRTIYFSRIRAAHNVAAENETIARLCEVAEVDRDSFKSIDLLQSVFGVSGWRSTMQTDRVYMYDQWRNGKGYTHYWQITETPSNQLTPTIY